MSDTEFDRLMEEQRIAYESRKKAQLEDPTNKPFIDAIASARDSKELARAKRALQKADDAGDINIQPGFWMPLYDAQKAKFASMREDSKRLANQAQGNKDARMDRLLRIRDSSGKATARKF